MDYEDIALAVKKGAAWLDENHPGWAARINLNTLSMNNCERCVIGQSVGNYFNSLHNNLIENLDWDSEHGFNIPTDFDESALVKESREYWRTLEEFWTIQVKDRTDVL